jgi:hypothetical protein
MVTSYANGYIFSEFDPSALSFTIGQYPSRSAEGAQYTIRQTLRYRKNASSYANANFIFHVTVGGSITSSNLQSIDYADPTGVNETATFGTESTPRQIYNLQGQRLDAPQRGMNIINGRKVVIK